MITKLSASVFALMIKSGANNLTNSRAEVDALNVFPVPDGDTGTNMSLTFKNAAKNIPYDSDSVEKVAAAAASYTLRGARGNSGVILSQIFRGIASVSKGKTELSARDFALCLRDGCNSAYGAVMKPTEGTILTVIRACADAAEECEEEDLSLFFDYICQKGNDMLRQTTNMLPALSQAGVVDAGGKGLMLIFEGMAHYLKSGSVIEASETEQTAEGAAPQASIRTEDIKFAYCTEFIIDKKTPAIRADKFKDAISKVGDCMVVIDDTDIIKVHIHTNNPGFVLEHAVRLGELATVKIENMKVQHSSIVNKPEEKSEEPVKKPHTANAVIAVVSGDGIKKMFTDMGAAVISGGQTMNPSTEDILSAVENIDADNIFVLPNNKNIIMAAEQAAEISDLTITVIPTKSIPQGISAMVAFDPYAALEENASAMERAAKGVTTGLVTHAVRDTELDGKEIKTGDILGMLEKEIVSVGTDATETAKDILSKMVTDESSLITVIFGEGLSETEAAGVKDFAELKYPDCDVSFFDGEQPVYSFILSVE